MLRCHVHRVFVSVCCITLYIVACPVFHGRGTARGGLQAVHVSDAARERAGRLQTKCVSLVVVIVVAAAVVLVGMVVSGVGMQN